MSISDGRGVGGPRAPGERGPAGGGGGVDADELAEQCWWDLGGELGASGVAHPDRFDPDGAETFAEHDGADMTSGGVASQIWCNSRLTQAPHVEVARRV